MEEAEKPAAWTKLLGGGIAGATETMVTYPTEYLKTRRQLPNSANTASSSSVSIIQSTYRDRGFAGFYSGCGALAVSNALKSGIRFFSYSTTKDYLQKTIFRHKEQGGPWVNILAGLSAGVIESLLVVTPGEALKTRMVEDAASAGRGRFVNRGVAYVTRTVVKEEGIGALWKGAVPVLSKQATNSAVRFTSFGLMQEQVAARWPSLEGNIGTTLAMGAVSGVVTVYASMPFDIVKTQIQSAGGNYNGMVDCAAKILQVDGFRGLWKGTTPRLVRLMLSSGITFTVYDQVVRAVSILRKKPREEPQIL